MTEKEKREAVFRSKGRSGWSASRADSVSWLPIPPRRVLPAKLVGRKPGHHFILHIYFDIRGRESFDIQSVIITLRIHLFPFRTQKLSSAVLKILGGKLPGKISRRRHQTLFIRTGFFLLSGSIWHLSAGIAMVLRNFLTASAILVKNTTGGIL